MLEHMPGDHDGVGDGVTERPLVGDDEAEAEADREGDTDGIDESVAVHDGVGGGQATGPDTMTRTR